MAARCTSLCECPHRETKVSELIDEDTRKWDRGKIHALFDSRACEDILAVPLNQLSSPDKLIWKENRTHSFSVRTAYQVALRLKNPHQAEHSSVQVHGSTWRRIWKLNVPPKVSTFIWRACSNCLPTRENLHRRWIRVESTCEICHQQPETNSHLLWECPFAQNVWALFKGRIQKSRNEASDFFLLFNQMQQKLSKLDFGKMGNHGVGYMECKK